MRSLASLMVRIKILMSFIKKTRLILPEEFFFVILNVFGTATGYRGIQELLGVKSEEPPTFPSGQVDSRLLQGKLSCCSLVLL
jgi:hypothetical protein